MTPKTSPNGIDALLRAAPTLSGLRWGLVTNDAARTADGKPSRAALLESGWRILRLFAPEHGLYAIGEDGAAQPDGKDVLTGLPVVSLYSSRMAPGPEHLHGLDALLFDIPDIGCRFYTYLWTMTHVMEACAAQGIPLFVADRANPIGTILGHAEGPMLDEANCASFIGRWDIPLKHACTLGELARLFAKERMPQLDLHVVTVPGYARRHARTTDPFHPTSPAMPTLQSALLYPGLGLVEGLNLNEGRGTDGPFTVIGAPWLEVGRIIEDADAECLEGTALSPGAYTAMAGPYAGERCQCLCVTVTDPSRLMAVGLGIELLRVILLVHGGLLGERPYPTMANPSGKGHLDRLLGIPKAFEKIGSTRGLARPAGAAWYSRVEDSLLYR